MKYVHFFSTEKKACDTFSKETAVNRRLLKSTVDSDRGKRCAKIHFSPLTNSPSAR